MFLSFVSAALIGLNLPSIQAQNLTEKASFYDYSISVTEEQPEQAREKTVSALKYIAKSDWKRAQRAIADANDPLASKIYDWMMFQERGSDVNFDKLASFIKNNPDWPGRYRLILRAEEEMPKDLPTAQVLNWFEEFKPKTPAAFDRFVRALLEAGQKDKAKAYLADWWATTPLSRSDQRLIYNQYKSLLDFDAHHRRFDMLLLRGQYTNARGIAQVLENGYPQLAEARIALAAKSGNVDALISKVPSRLKDDPGLEYERLKWRREKDLNNRALEILYNPPPADKIQNPEDWWRERHIMIRRLLEKKKYEGAYLLARNHIQKDGFTYAQAEWIAGWLALRFVNQPESAYHHFEALYAQVESPISKARAAYWAGRAASAFEAHTLARQWYERAARFQTVFYGQMAGSILGLEKALPHGAPPLLTQSDLERFAKNELIQAAKLFHEAGLYGDTSDFLQAFADSDSSPKAYRFSAELASSFENHYASVKIAKEATTKGLFLTAQSYPTITKHLSHVNNVEWALVHALIRQESMFDYAALSHAGASGVMQIMPATARAIARKIGVRHQTDWLKNPDHNIRLGTAYMAELLDRYGGSYPLAIAAYNAGPGRVNSWLKTFGDPRKGEVDWTDWIELIPIYETRNYVQRVLEGVYVYRLRLQNYQKTPTNAIHVAFHSK